MPPKRSYTKDHVIDAALNVVKNRGAEFLNARSIAEEMGSSTQPIYSLFTSMQEVEQELIDYSLPIAMDYMLRAEDEESHFLSIGLGYLEFSQREPGLFRFLYSSGQIAWDFTLANPYFKPLLEKMRKDFCFEGFSDGQLFSLLSNMFIYAHGLCTLKIVSANEESDGLMRKRLHDLGGDLIMMEMIKRHEKDDLGLKMKEMMHEHPHT